MAKVLSIRPPWSIWIIYGSKDVENRVWRYPPKYRGRLYIHCSKKTDTSAVVPILVDKIKELQLINSNFGLGKISDVAGAIIGYVELDDIRRGDIDSPWYTGDLGLILSNPQPLAKPVPWRGQLGIFNAPDEVLEAANRERIIQEAR